MNENHGQRIELGNDLENIFAKLSDGNSDALRVCLEIFRKTTSIDPYILGGFGYLFYLDTFGIYGSRIWMLYKDICGESLVDMLGLLKAVRFEYLSKSVLDHAIDNCGDGLDVQDYVKKVKEKLPKFGSADEKVQKETIVLVEKNAK